MRAAPERAAVRATVSAGLPVDPPAPAPPLDAPGTPTGAEDDGEAEGEPEGAAQGTGAPRSTAVGSASIGGAEAVACPGDARVGPVHLGRSSLSVAAPAPGRGGAPGAAAPAVQMPKEAPSTAATASGGPSSSTWAAARRPDEEEGDLPGPAA